MQKSDFIGSWQLVSHGLTKTDGAFIQTGTDMAGQLIYAADGALSVLILKKRSPSNLEDIIAYSGRFTVEGDRITHHIQVAPQAKRIGTSEIRIASLEGNQLTLRTESTDVGVYEITWKRII